MENKINIGGLDTKVALYTTTKTKGEQGEIIRTYTKHSEVYANVSSNVAEYIANENYEQSVDLQITIYKVTGLDTRWRVKVADHNYEITAIDPVSRVSPFCVLTLHAID